MIEGPGLALYIAALAIGAACMLYRKTPSRAFTLSMALSVTAILWVMWASEGVSNEETIMLIAPQFCIMAYSVWGMTFSGRND
jgi:hypothetical protein